MEQVFFRLHLRIYSLSHRFLNRHTRRVVEASAFIVAIFCLISAAILHTKYVTKANLTEENYLLHILDQPALWEKALKPPIGSAAAVSNISNISDLFNTDNRQYRSLKWTNHMKTHYDVVLLKVLEAPRQYIPSENTCEEYHTNNNNNNNNNANETIVDTSSASSTDSDGGERSDHCVPKRPSSDLLLNEKVLFEDEYVSVQSFDIVPHQLYPYLYPHKANATTSFDASTNNTLVNSYLFSYKRHTIMYLQDTLLTSNGLFASSKRIDETDFGFDSELPRVTMPLRVLELQYYPKAQRQFKQTNAAGDDNRRFLSIVEEIASTLLSYWTGSYDVPMIHWVEQAFAFYTGGYLYTLQRKEMLTLTPTVSGTNKRSMILRHSTLSARAFQRIADNWITPFKQSVPNVVHVLINVFPGENALVGLVNGIISQEFLPAEVPPISPDSLQQTALPENGWYEYLFFRLGMIFSTSFLLFIGSTLISYILRETQDRMLRFTYLLQYYITHNLPFLPLVFLHVTENLVFVPILMGIYFFLFEFYSDQLLAFLVLLVVWMGEIFSVLCLRNKTSIYYFPKYFALYFFLFHFYFFTFPNGFTYLTLLSVTALIFQVMCHLWNEYEVPGIESGRISHLRPREHITTTMQTVAAASNSMMHGSNSSNSVPALPVAPGMRQMIQQQRMRNAAAAAAIVIGSYPRIPASGSTHRSRSQQPSQPQDQQQAVSNNPNLLNSNTAANAATSYIDPIAINASSSSARTRPRVEVSSPSQKQGDATAAAAVSSPQANNRSRSNSGAVVPSHGASIYETLDARRLRLANAALQETTDNTGTATGGGGGTRSRGNSWDSSAGYSTLGAILRETDSSSQIFSNSIGGTRSRGNSWDSSAGYSTLGAILRETDSSSQIFSNSIGVKSPMNPPLGQLPVRLTSESLPKIEVNRIEWLMNASSDRKPPSIAPPPVTAKILPDGGQQVYQRGIGSCRGPGSIKSRTNTEDEYAEVIGNFIDDDDSPQPRRYKNTTATTTNNNYNPTATNTTNTTTNNTNTANTNVNNNASIRPVQLTRGITSSTTSSSKEYGYSNSDFNIFGSYGQSEDNLANQF